MEPLPVYINRNIFQWVSYGVIKYGYDFCFESIAFGHIGAICCADPHSRLLIVNISSELDGTDCLYCYMQNPGQEHAVAIRIRTSEFLIF